MTLIIMVVFHPPPPCIQPELRETAFATLRSIASIDNKSQLYELLCDLGILRKLKMDEVGVYIIIDTSEHCIMHVALQLGVLHVTC